MCVGRAKKFIGKKLKNMVVVQNLIKGKEYKSDIDYDSEPEDDGDMYYSPRDNENDE